jgi:hypothetical protein
MPRAPVLFQAPQERTKFPLPKLLALRWMISKNNVSRSSLVWKIWSSNLRYRDRPKSRAASTVQVFIM